MRLGIGYMSFLGRYFSCCILGASFKEGLLDVFSDNFAHSESFTTQEFHAIAKDHSRIRQSLA